MLITYLLLCIFGLLLVIISMKLRPLAHALEDRHQRKQEYQRLLLESVQNIETAVVSKPEDPVKGVLQALEDLRRQQNDQETVQTLIDSLDDDE